MSSSVVSRMGAVSARADDQCAVGRDRLVPAVPPSPMAIVACCRTGLGRVRGALLGSVAVLLAAAAPGPGATPGGTTTGTRPGGAPDSLQEALRTAPDAATAAALERQLRERSLAQVTPAVRLLLARARREAEAGQSRDALEDLDAALDLQPDSPELHRQRAEVRANAGDYPGAVRDIQDAVTREPGDVAAWTTLSHLAQARGDWRNAFEAWRRVLELDPRTDGGASRLDELRRRAFGQPA